MLNTYSYSVNSRPSATYSERRHPPHTLAKPLSQHSTIRLDKIDNSITALILSFLPPPSSTKFFDVNKSTDASRHIVTRSLIKQSHPDWYEWISATDDPSSIKWADLQHKLNRPNCFQSHPIPAIINLTSTPIEDSQWLVKHSTETLLLHNSRNSTILDLRKRTLSPLRGYSNASSVADLGERVLAITRSTTIEFDRIDICRAEANFVIASLDYTRARSDPWRLGGISCLTSLGNLLLAVGTRQHGVEVWDAQKWVHRRSIPIDASSSLCFLSPTQLAIGSEKDIYIYNLQTGCRQKTLLCETFVNKIVMLTPRCLASLSHEVVDVWDLEKDRKIWQFSTCEHGKVLEALPPNLLAFKSNNEKRILIVSVKTGKEIAWLEHGNDNNIIGMAIMPDWRIVGLLRPDISTAGWVPSSSIRIWTQLRDLRSSGRSRKKLKRGTLWRIVLATIVTSFVLDWLQRYVFGQVGRG